MAKVAKVIATDNKVADIRQNIEKLAKKYDKVQFTSSHKLVFIVFLGLYCALIVKSLSIDGSVINDPNSSWMPIIWMMSPLILAAINCVALHFLPWMTLPLAKFLSTKIRLAYTSFLVGYAVFGMSLLITFLTLNLNYGWIARVILFFVSIFYATLIAPLKRLGKDMKEIANA